MTEPARLITCVLPLGQGRRLLASLRRDEGVTSAELHHARGLGRVSGPVRRGVASGTARDVLEIVVDAARAEPIFERLYYEARIDQEPGALLYVTRLETATRWQLPDLPDEA